MKSINCRVDDDIAEQLRLLAQNEGKSAYTLTAEILTQYVRDDRALKSENEDRLSEMQSSLKAQQRNIRIVAEVVIALLTAQVGEQQADEILQKITSEV